MTGTGGAAEAALGTSVYDTATFSGVTTGFTPTASDVSYQFNSVAAGSGLQSNTSAALGAGSYGYAVTFAGDSNYNAITTAVNEPLQIDKGTLTLSTTIYNATTNAALPLDGHGRGRRGGLGHERVRHGDAQRRDDRFHAHGLATSATSSTPSRRAAGCNRIPRPPWARAATATR